MKNKGAYQTARMRRLACACVVCKPPEDRFPRDEAHITVSGIFTFVFNFCFCFGAEVLLVSPSWNVLLLKLASS